MPGVKKGLPKDLKHDIELASPTEFVKRLKKHFASADKGVCLVTSAHRTIAIGNKKTKALTELLEHITRRLKQERIEFKIHKFDSGAVMVDIWKDNLFYVVQIESGKVGLSLIKDNTALDTIPDKIYRDKKQFLMDFEECIKGVWDFGHGN